MSEQLSADVVVIGSGICGSLVAQRLAKQGVSVIILESGPRIDRGTLTENFRNSPRKKDFMSPYPYSDWSPHPVYKPEDNDYLQQQGPFRSRQNISVLWAAPPGTGRRRRGVYCQMT